MRNRVQKLSEEWLKAGSILAVLAVLPKQNGRGFQDHPFALNVIR